MSFIDLVHYLLDNRRAGLIEYQAGVPYSPGYLIHRVGPV